MNIAINANASKASRTRFATFRANFCALSAKVNRISLNRRRTVSIKPPKCDYQNYDGVSYEEDKAAYRKLTGPKSRFSFPLTSKAKDNYDDIDWTIKTKSK